MAIELFRAIDPLAKLTTESCLEVEILLGLTVTLIIEPKREFCTDSTLTLLYIFNCLWNVEYREEPRLEKTLPLLVTIISTTSFGASSAVVFDSLYFLALPFDGAGAAGTVDVCERL